MLTNGLALTLLRQAAIAELSEFLQEEGSQFPARIWLWQALRTRGKLLAPEDGFCWGLLPILACDAAGGDPRKALPLGVAMDCLIAALDAIDDVQDGDDPNALWRACGLPTATNVATLLLFLAQLALVRLERRGISTDTVNALVRTFATSGARACGGQQRDLDLGRGERITEEQYLALISQKSASLVECACRSGALLGTSTPSVIESYARFGYNLGMAMQIQNDIAGVYAEAADRCDLTVAKPTLPLVFAFDCAIAADREDLLEILPTGRSDDLRPDEIKRLRSILESSGALFYATTIADVYVERAINDLEDAGCPHGSPLFDLTIRMRSD